MQRLLAMSVQFMDTKLCCAFCNLDRIDDDLGNLSIQFSVKIGKETKNLVAHENCVVWCPEVYQKKDKFMGVESAFKRGQMLVCYLCFIQFIRCRNVQSVNKKVQQLVANLLNAKDLIIFHVHSLVIATFFLTNF